MDQERRRRVLALMESVLDLPQKERKAYLAKRCQDDPDLYHAAASRLAMNTSVFVQKLVSSLIGRTDTQSD